MKYYYEIYYCSKCNSTDINIIRKLNDDNSYDTLYICKECKHEEKHFDVI